MCDLVRAAATSRSQPSTKRMQPNANSTENLRHKKSLSPIQKGKGLSSRGDRRFTFPNDMGSLRLFRQVIAQTVEITADAIYGSRS